MAKIQIKRGLDTNLPIGDSGEPLWTTDDFKLYIGDGTTNHLINWIDSLLISQFTNDAGYITSVPTPSLTNTYVGVGNGSNQLSGSANFSFDYPNQLLHIAFASGDVINVDVNNSFLEIVETSGGGSLIFPSFGEFRITTAGNGSLSLNNNTSIYSIGAVGFGNSTNILINDTGSRNITLDADNGVIVTNLIGTGTQMVVADINGLLSKQAIPSAGVTNVTATSPITSSGGSTSDISTSMATNKLIGRSTAGTGVMEEITLGTNLSFTGTTLNAANGVWVLISSATASSSATIDFTGFTSAYKFYVIIFDGLTCSTNTTNLTFRVGTGAGPTYQTGAVYESQGLTASAGVGLAASGGSGLTSIGFGTLGNTANDVVSGQILIINPSHSSGYHDIQGEVNVHRTSYGTSGRAKAIQSGAYQSSTPVTAARIAMSSGDIVTGNFYLYGIQ